MNKNNNISKIEEIKGIVNNMPYFTIQGLSSLDIKDCYLKIILSRLKEREEILSLKRGVYVSQKYLEEVKRKNIWNEYMEFLCSVLYSPSYLSLEYVLNEHNVLSEACFGFSAVSTKKTNRIKNRLGCFHYYNIKEDLFCGFEMQKKDNFFIYKATLGKALFDFLYLRKNIIVNKDFLKSLRINTDQINKDDFKEFEKYVAIEGSKKMKKISKFYAG